MKIMQCFALGLLVLVLTGCGSFLGRMTQRDKPYPGWRFTTSELTSKENLGFQQILWLDVPLSLAMDTVLLPIDALEASSKYDDATIDTPHTSPRQAR